MKKLIIAIVAALVCVPLVGYAIHSYVSKPAVKEIVIFSQPCYFCEKLKNYLATSNLVQRYPEIEIRVLDIQEPKNRAQLEKYAKKYNLTGDIGMPLMFVGDNYIMGWSDDWAGRLDMYILEYLGRHATPVDVSR